MKKLLIPNSSRRISWWRCWILLMVIHTAAAGVALADPASWKQIEYVVNIESSPQSNLQTTSDVVWSQVIDLGDVPWIRLFFDSVNLEGDSYLVVTSHLDGEMQILNRQSLEEWGNSTAYFNGPSVTVELIAAPKTSNNAVSIKRVIAGDTTASSGLDEIQRVCSTVDTRTASNNPATARMSNGCTGWMIQRGPSGNPNDRCFLSAGHCFPGGATAVMQFDVPLSNSNCSLNQPPVSKQFPVNPATVQFVNGGMGNDWSVFRCFANSNTGKTAFQEQGAAFPLAAAVVPGPATKFGYGVDGDPVSTDGNDFQCICRPNDAQAPNTQTQQTSSGLITAVVVNLVAHNLQDCGGDSGEVIINGANEAVAIGTHGSCSGGAGGTPDNHGTAITHPDLQAAIVACGAAVPVINVPGSVLLPDTCVGRTNTATLNVCNTGDANLVISNITSSSSEITVTPPSSGYELVISPDSCFPFQVEFTPTSTGAKSANLTIASNDPATPSLVVKATGNGVQPKLAALIANSGNFGDVCLGSLKDLDLTISNSGGCDLIINGITSNQAEFVVPNVVSFPLTIHAGGSIAVPIRFQPTSLGSKIANITVASNDPTTPNKIVAVSGNVPPGDIRVTGSTDFGDVCPEEAKAEKTINICNVGKCNLTVTSVGFNPACTDFALINNPFPATVSPGSCNDVVIRFTPTSVGPKSCTLKISSDDPDSATITETVTANTPSPSIDVPADQCFLPEVIQSVGACTSQKTFPISNTGKCNLIITNVAVTGDPGGDHISDYSLAGLPSYPIILQPGHVIGEGNFKTVFAPTDLDRDLMGTLTVRYVTDPFLNTTADVQRSLSGEGVRTGARVLVTAGGVPLTTVEKIQLQRITANRNKKILDTQDVVQDATLQIVTPSAPCGSFQYHREYGTVSNPIQLLPGSYQVTATGVVGKKRVTRTVGFDVGTCDFNPNIVINLN